MSVLLETGEVVAWNKPAGLPSTGRDLQDPDCAQFQAMQHTGRKLWALHQLDRDTSGVLLFARKKSVVATWQERWNTDRFKKFYLAIVHGHLTRSPLLIDAPLKKIRRPGYTEVTVSSDGQSAQTEVVALSHSEHYSLVVARLLTGRTHQIRVHLQHIGCPLVGESRYNAIPCAHHERHALHALAILTDEPPPLHRIEAPLAPDLVALAKKLDISLAPLQDWHLHFEV